MTLKVFRSTLWAVALVVIHGPEPQDAGQSSALMHSREEALPT